MTEYYVVDSIVVDREIYCFVEEGTTGTGGPVGGSPLATEAVFPEAEYKFDLGNPPTQEPLIPSLQISPADRPEIPFVLVLGYSGPDNCHAIPRISVHYHRMDGLEGYLTLRKPSETEHGLSRLLGTNIHFATSNVLVTPDGFSIGADETVQPLYYTPLELGSSYGTGVTVENWETRQAFNTALASHRGEAEIVELARQGDPIGINLCAGLLTQSCEQALLDVLHNQSLRDEMLVAEAYETIAQQMATAHRPLQLTLDALAIRHFLAPDDTLLTTVSSELDFLVGAGLDVNQAYRVIVDVQHAGWFDVVRQIEQEKEAHDIFYVCGPISERVHELTDEQRREVEDWCAN